MAASGEIDLLMTERRVWRRGALKGGIAALCALGGTLQAGAANRTFAKVASRANSDEWTDRVAITDMILLERWARETHNADVAATCYNSDAWIEVSWFKGTASEFIETGKHEPSETVNFDAMSPPVIWVQDSRAIAETSCAVHTVLALGGIDVINISYTRLLWRLQKTEGRWLISGLRGIYIRDTLASCGPSQSFKIDEEKLAAFRPSYRYLSYVLAASGRPVRNDLPGVDRPETVDALRAAERRWLNQV